MIESMPKKYDTMLGRLFGEHDLSRGEWQKLATRPRFGSERLYPYIGRARR